MTADACDRCGTPFDLDATGFGVLPMASSAVKPVVVVNAARIRVTGNKRADKVYYRHTGYPGGIRSRTLPCTSRRRPRARWTSRRSC